jgi:hypothetical protein
MKSIRSYPVGAEHGANIITVIVTIFGEKKFRRTLENCNRHCNYSLYYGIQHPEISIFRYEHYKIPDTRNPGLYSWAVGIKECSSDDNIQK